MSFWTQYQEKYIIRSLPRPFICIYMSSDVFTMWIRWDTKTMSVHLLSRVARYVGYCNHNVLLKIVAITTYSLSSEYYGRHYMKDDASISLLKCMFLSSLLANKYCWKYESASSILINLWVFLLKDYKTFYGYLGYPSSSFIILLVTCRINDLLITDIF